MTYIIREASPEDLDTLVALYQDYFTDLKACGMNFDLRAENLPRVLQARIRSHLLLAAVAEAEDGTVAGFVFASILRLGAEYSCGGAASVGYINELYVTPAVRRQGLSRRLADFGEDWLRGQGVTAVQAQVLAGNSAAHTMWQARGMAPVGTLYEKKL